MDFGRDVLLRYSVYDGVCSGASLARVLSL